MFQSFFGRTYNNLSSISECKNNGECVINKKNRTACKACRLRKCLFVGMSKSGSRYGRRSNWFKIHCLLQEQQQKSPPLYPLLPPALMPAAALAGYYKNNNKNQEEPRRSVTPSDSGASSADPEDDNSSRSASVLSFLRPTSSPLSDKDYFSNNNQKPKEATKRKTITLNIPSSPFGSSSSISSFSPRSGPFLPALKTLPSNPLSAWSSRTGGDLLLCSPALAGVAVDQDQPIDLSIKSSAMTCRSSVKNEDCSDSEPELSIDLKDDEDAGDSLKTPLDLTLVSKRTEEVPLKG